MTQKVKDPALPLLWRRINPQPGNFHISRAWPKEIEKKKKRKEINITQKHPGKVAHRNCPEQNKVNERKYVKQNKLKTEC